MSRLLNRIRVLESAILLNGSTLGMLLGDMGADVVKLESPRQGDYLRDFLGQVAPHHSPAFMECNRNKRSLTLDVRTDKGRTVFFRLIEQCDVFIDGFTAGAADALGIGFEAQRNAKPNIVYAHYTGWGAGGPYATVPTHGGLMVAMAGASPMQFDESGTPQPAAVEDDNLYGGSASGGEATATGAAYMAANVVAALLYSSRTGEAVYLDGSATDAVIASGHIGTVYTLNRDRILDVDELPAMTTPELNSKYTYYRTKDDRILLFAAIEPKFWKVFCKLAERPDLVGKVDEDTPADWGYFAGLREEVQGIFATRTLDEWMQIAVDEHLPIGPVNAVEDLRHDPQLSSREIIVDRRHPVAVDFTYVGSPVVVAGQPFTIERHAPSLGQHTDEVLAEFGLNQTEIDHLRRSRVV